MAFWDQPAETMPPGERLALQMARIRACVERLQRSGNPFYARLDGIDAASLRAPDDLAPPMRSIVVLT